MISGALFLGLGLVMGQAGAASPARVAAIEIPFSTGVGAGASGLKRFFDNGCYQVMSEGGAGGSKTRDSQAGCHLPHEVAEVFERLNLLASASGGAIVKENQAPQSSGSGKQSAPRAQARAILVRADGSRWVAANDEVAGEFFAAINGMPGENQWHAKPPASPVGKGPQFVAISAATGGDGARKVQASLSADGRWWCHRKVSGGGDAGGLRTPKLAPVSPREGSARLQRILQGARPKTGMDDDEDVSDAAGVETSVEVVFAGRSRSALFPKRLAKTVSKRFSTDMIRHSEICALP